MQDKKSTVRLLRGFSIVLFLFAMGVFGARMFGGFDISPVMPLVLVVALLRQSTRELIIRLAPWAALPTSRAYLACTPRV